MILRVDSDAAYLVAPKARSRVAGYYYLSSLDKSPRLNGAVHVECKTLRHVVASAAEAETAGVFHNAQIVLPIRRILEALNHPQPPTPIKTDKFHYEWIHTQQYTPEKIQIVGYAILLVERQKNSTAVKFFLGEGQN